MVAMLGDPVELSLAASRKGAIVNALLEVQVGPGFHIYSPNTADGIPLTVELSKGWGLQTEVLEIPLGNRGFDPLTIVFSRPRDGVVG